MRLATDPTLRQALHGLYVALFNAKHACPEDFHGGRLTTIQTAIMGIEDYGWRVVGITREALDLLASADFNKNKLPRQLCRGHIVDRIATTRMLFEREAPLGLEEFFEVFLHNDRTVIMLNMQGHTPGHHSLLVKLKETGNVLITGDLSHFRENYDSDGVPTFNTDRAASLASIDRFKKIAANLKATVIIQHDARDVGRLPAFPMAAK